MSLRMALPCVGSGSSAASGPCDLKITGSPPPPLLPPTLLPASPPPPPLRLPYAPAPAAVTTATAAADPPDFLLSLPPAPESMASLRLDARRLLVTRLRRLATSSALTCGGPEGTGKIIKIEGTCDDMSTSFELRKHPPKKHAFRARVAASATSASHLRPPLQAPERRERPARARVAPDGIHARASGEGGLQAPRLPSRGIPRHRRQRLVQPLR